MRSFATTPENAFVIPRSRSRGLAVMGGYYSWADTIMGAPLLVVEDAANKTSSASFIADGPWGHQLRFGAHGPETLQGLAWIRDVAAPAFQAVLEREGPVDLASLMAQALTMGDEMHMRNAAATGLLARRLAAPLAGVVAKSADLEAVLRFITKDNDQFFLAWSMCAAKAAARSIDGLEGSTI